MRENHPRYDFRIDSFTCDVFWESYSIDYTLYKGIKGLDFFASNILFIPPIKDLVQHWYPAVPYPTQVVKTLQDTRLWVLMLEGNFVVTPCDEWAGEVKVIPYNYLKECRLEGQEITVFFVTKEEFRRYIKEIGNINIQEKRCIFFSKLGRESIIYKLFEEKILNTSYLSEYQLEAIRRTRLENKCVVPISIKRYHQRLKKIQDLWRINQKDWGMKKEYLNNEIELAFKYKNNVLDDLAIMGIAFEGMRDKLGRLYDDIIELEDLLKFI